MDAQMKCWLTRLGRCQIMPQLAILGINLHQSLRGHGGAGLRKNTEQGNEASAKKSRQLWTDMVGPVQYI